MPNRLRQPDELLLAHATHPEVRALDTFQVPYCWFGRDQRATHISQAAAALFLDEGAGVLEQLSRAVHRVLSDARYNIEREAFTMVMEVPVLSGQHVASIHLPKRPSEALAALAVMRPAAPPSGGGRSSDAIARLLSPREYEIANLMATGMTNREIAERVHLSLHTVRRHGEKLFEKLGVQSRTAVTRLVLEQRRSVA
jgi:DNA-binding NarL/FixJ family response regulator